MTLQLKPYLQVRRSGDTLRIGNMPPRGIEIDEAPIELDEVIRVLSSPTTRAEAAAQLDGVGGISAEGWTETIDQLIEAGVVGERIPDDGRYARHLLYFDLLGLDSSAVQHWLGEATVAIVGTGGIGSNVATLLAAAGVGHLILTDGDTIEQSNLTRQVLYDEDTIGQVKVHAAERRLRKINSEIDVSTIESAATRELFMSDLSECDVVIVSADSPDEIHEWVDDGARLHGYAYIAAGYIEGHGSIGPLVLPGSTACYECMRQDEHALDFKVRGDVGIEGMNLNKGLQAASYGPLNLMVASIAANEIIRLLAGAACETAGRRILLDSRNYAVTTEDFERRDGCPGCAGQSPHPSAHTAVTLTSIEDVYDVSRSTDSMNAVVLDDFLHDLAQPRTGERVFDYGCGSGEQSIRLAEAGTVVTAYDPSPGMIRQLSETLDTRRDISVGVVQSLPSDPATDRYDLIVCTNVLDLIPPGAVEEAVSWMSRHLAAYGRVIVTVPHPVKDGARWIRTGRADVWEYNEVRLGEYFGEGPIHKHWETSSGNISLRSLRSYHRTLSTYASLFSDNGFYVAGLQEPQPPAGAEIDYPEIWAKTSKVPYFLTFELRHAL